MGAFVHDGLQTTYLYDLSGRLVSETTTTTSGAFISRISYTYEDGKDRLKALRVETENNGFIEDTLEYTYDGKGNIVSISQKATNETDWTSSYRYEYDSLNQLTRVDDAVQQKTFAYSYDNNGNLQSVKTYAYTTESLEGVTPEDTKTYTYGNTSWKDQLTGYDGGTITYDSIGNPLTYYDGAVFTWTEGRKLASYTKGDTSITYQYDGNGLRSEKIVNVTTTKYRYIGGSLFGEYTGNKSLTYQYDEAGKCIGFIYNNGTTSQTYYYLYNLQGDVIAVFDTNGSCVAKYRYDAWGKMAAITDGSGTDVSENAAHIANVNPLRYKGYYYDAETGLYYLGSRYYDGKVSRFINADGYVSTGQGTMSYNMYTYCGNNPVNRIDPTGMFWSNIKIVISNAWDRVKTWVKNTFKPDVKTTNDTPLLDAGDVVRVKIGIKQTITTENNTNNYKPISIYSGTEYNGGSNVLSVIGMEGNIFQTDVSATTEAISYSKTKNFVVTQISYTYSVTKDGRLGFEYGSTIVWDGAEYTGYIAVDTLFQIPVAVALLATCNLSGLSLLVPVAQNSK